MLQTCTGSHLQACNYAEAHVQQALQKPWAGAIEPMHQGAQDRRFGARRCAHAGSELCLAIDAAKEIEASGKKARVVSAVCWELFEDQDESYKNSVLPPDVTARVSHPNHLEIRCVCRLFLYSIDSSCLCSQRVHIPWTSQQSQQREEGVRGAV